MKELQETLINLGFEVRLDNDGNEVEKPIHPTHECSSFCKNCDQFALEIDKYKQATPVIKLPSPVEFWKALRGKPIHAKTPDQHPLNIWDDYMVLISQNLTKEMFVNEIPKPIGKKCCGCLQSGSDCDYGIIVCPGCNGKKESELGKCAGCKGTGIKTCGKCGGLNRC